MQAAFIKDITIPDNRQRREFNEAKLEELAKSMIGKGLLHPIVVRKVANTTGFILVAGERRLRAVQIITEWFPKGALVCDDEVVPPGKIPYTLLSDLDPLAIREAEFEENVLREDYTLNEKAAAVKALHELRLEQEPSHSAADTAEEITGDRRGSTDKVRDMILIADHQHLPEVANASNKKEAMKAIKKNAEAEMLSVLAEAYPHKEDDNCWVMQGDAYGFMLAGDEELYDCILTDPPYGVGANTFVDQSDLGHNYSDEPIVLDNIMQWFPEESYRITKPAAHLYFFCDIRRFDWLRCFFEKEGWNVWEKPLIWSKGNGMLPQPDHGPRYTYDAILFANKGQKRINHVAPDVLTYSAVAGQKLLHAAQKPVELYIDLLSRSCLPGDYVLDPFAGSGTIFPAAKSLRLKALGMEKDEANYNTCLARIKGAI